MTIRYWRTDMRFTGRTALAGRPDLREPSRRMRARLDPPPRNLRRFIDPRDHLSRTEGDAGLRGRILDHTAPSSNPLIDDHTPGHRQEHRRRS